MTVPAPDAISTANAGGPSKPTVYSILFDSRPAKLIVSVPDVAAANDEALVSAISRLTNEAYLESEKGIWNEGSYRTTPAEIAHLLTTSQLAVAFLQAEDTDDGTAAPGPPSLREGQQLAACLCIRQKSPEVGFLNMLAVDRPYQGLGLGRHMMAFAEKRCAELGHSSVGLDLLVPTEWAHPVKTRTQAWYQRLGYEVVELDDFEEVYPDLAPLLAGPVEFRVFEKKLS